MLLPSCAGQWPKAEQDVASKGTLWLSCDSAGMQIDGDDLRFSSGANMTVEASDLGACDFAIRGKVMVRSEGGDQWGHSLEGWHSGDKIELSVSLAVSEDEAAKMRRGESNGDEVHRLRFRLLQELQACVFVLTDRFGVEHEYSVVPNKDGIDSWKDLRRASGRGGGIELELKRG
ncbi:MAG TPA: hypothetical protein K8U77_00130 [Slackia equolifaciens]|uniref:Uncharacterized protein n=1 Tax=Slackia equolifaciens TaxID=498718 RepID=A0A9D2ZZR1_9ACTN|nr:hypothetical protein [Slackia equolifaciens]